MIPPYNSISNNDKTQPGKLEKKNPTLSCFVDSSASIASVRNFASQPFVDDCKDNNNRQPINVASEVAPNHISS